MKILTANIALGLRNMDNLFTNLRSGSKYHSLFSILVMVFLPPLRGRFSGPAYSPKRITFLRGHEDLNPTIKLISEANPDVLILNEVLPEIHRSRLDKELKNMGFVTISYGLDAKYPDAHLSTLVAVKEQGTPISITMPQTPHPGCGGGIAGIRLKGNITVTKYLIK